MSPLTRTGGSGTGVAPARERAQADRERAARVAELRDRYRAGAYRVNAKALAEAIIDQHLAAASKQ